MPVDRSAPFLVVSCFRVTCGIRMCGCDGQQSRRCSFHHHVHHSYYPAHVNKNFAFMFPIWDILFGTFQVPRTNDDVVFGLGDEDEEFTSCFGLYWTPFRELARSVRRPK